MRDGAVEVVFTGGDRGIDGDIEQAFQRSLTVEAARESGALLAYDLNGAPLPPQHGFPLRLVVPGWYGMTNVKWLTSIEVDRPALRRLLPGHVVQRPPAGRRPGRAGDAHRAAVADGAAGHPRLLHAGPARRGRRRARSSAARGRAGARSGRSSSATTAATTWAPAEVEPPVLGEAAWQGWRVTWDATPGDHELCCRATDEAREHAAARARVEHRRLPQQRGPARRRPGRLGG